MEMSPEGVVAYTIQYIQSMPAEIARGDIFAVTITLIAFFIAVLIINRLTGLLIVVLKKIILFIIIALAFWQFVMLFFARMASEGLTNDTIIFGAAGFGVGFIAISISLYVALHSFYEARKSQPSPESGEQAATAVQAAVPVVVQPLAGKTGDEGLFTGMKDTLSMSSLKSDKSLGAVLAYLVIAQFGVFSSKTIPAPSFQVGVAFFAIFIIAGLFFIHFTYNNYLTGLRHLLMAVLAGLAIAIILGHFWGGIPLDQLLSPAFFQSDALVALVTGLALSLFMGGKG